jgi:HSP20 family protein
MWAAIDHKEVNDMAALTRYQQGWPVMEEMQRIVDNAFQNWFAPTRAFQPGHPPWQAPESQWAPRVDVIQRNGDIVLRAELPGVDPEKDIEVQVEDDRVTIRGQRRQEVQTSDEQFVRVETNYGSFQRTLPLPSAVDPEQVRASYRNGVLEVAIPRSGSVERSRRVPVQTEGTNAQTVRQESGTSRARSSS